MSKFVFFCFLVKPSAEPIVDDPPPKPPSVNHHNSSRIRKNSNKIYKILFFFVLFSVESQFNHLNLVLQNIAFKKMRKLFHITRFFGSPLMTCTIYRAIDTYSNFSICFSNIFQQFPQTFFLRFPNIFQTFSTIFPNIFRTFRKMFRTFPEHFQTSSKLSPNIFRTFSKRFSNFFQRS